ncbi:Ig-like domain-containing protein [Chitinivorax sp. PXF-14]|uniref:Ig-like domain-containing protein n=1 Tax=Chitinivorax sp. PXF-14 TaxID=3230488 RepID=UPI003466726F
MFDGAVATTAATALHADASHLIDQRPAEAAPAARSAAAELLADKAVATGASDITQKQVVFLESNVTHYQSLLAQMPAGMEVVVLDASRDGLSQIADWAKTHHGYAAIHIISHGQSGDLMLGSNELTTTKLDSRQTDLQAIGQSLRAGGDILLYGCDIGAGSSGAAFVSELGRYTQADVAASTDATGAARLGGDWALERSSGHIDVDALHFSYDALLARPVTGTTDFTTSDSNTYNPSGSVVNAGNLQGWDFSLQLGFTNNGGQTIIVEKAGSVTTETVDGYSDGNIPISYFSVKSNDNSHFTLNSIGVVLNGYDSGTSGGNLQLVGYINGSAVSGATLTLNVGDVLQGSGGLVTFNVSSNSAFQGIDSFRMLAANGHNVTGMIGIGAINAINFGFAPALSASGGSSAYSSGNGSAVVVDSGITLSDSDSATQASATVSVTGNFHSGEDVLAFTNNGSTMGNIVASYNSSTGVLTLTSSGATATLAQWQAALRAVTYSDSSLLPITSNRTISFAINDGAINSSAVTKTVTVAADAAPVIGNLNGDNPTFTEAGGAVKLDTGTAATVTDSDTANFNGGNLTVHISANGQGGQDVLGVDASGTVTLSSGTNVGSVVTVGGVSIGVIASNGDGVSGHDLVVTLNSNATAARVSTLVAALTYNNTSNDPNAATRTINVSVADGRGGTGSSNVTVAVAAVNDAPTASATASNPTFAMGGSAVAVFSGASVNTVEPSQSVILLTLTVSGLQDGSNEILAIDGSNVALTNGNSVTTSGNGLSATVSLSGGTATVSISSSGISGSTAASVVNGISYRDSSGSPSAGNRVVTLTSVKDSGGTSNGGVDTTTLALASTVNVAVVPVVTPSGGSAAFTSGDNTASTPVAVDGGLTVTDSASPTLVSATVSITGNFQSGEDVLAFTNNGSTMGNIVASYNSGTGVLTLTSSGGSATLAQWQAALRAVTYTDSAVMPNTATRTVSFQVNDGSASSSVATRTVTVTATDQTPIATASGGSAAFTAGDNTASTPVAVDSGITVSDLDNTTLASATVSITGNFHSGEDVLAFSNTNSSTYGNIVASYNSGTGVLTLTSSGATATLAQWQAALRAVTYTDSAATPNIATRTISFSINDGTKNSVATTRSVTVAATDQSPIATTSGGSAAFTAGDNATSMPVVVDSGLTVSDLDNTTLASARVSISGNFQSGQDVLAFSNTNSSTYGNIVASYNSGTGVLTLTSSGGTATLAQWQAALRAVTYTDSAVTPNTATRTISFSVNDGSKDSTAVTRTVTVAATDQTPIASTTGSAGTYIVGGGATQVDDGLTVSDLDNTTLASATVAITGNFHSGEDVLAFTNNGSTMGNIVASYNAGTGVLTLTSSGATATLAQWQAALRAITYNDTAGSPNTATRTISIAVNDGTNSSAAVHRSIAIQLPAPSIAGLTTATDTGSSNTDGITGNNMPTLTGSVVAGSLVTVYVDSVSAGTTTANGSGAWSFSFGSPLGDASHAITVMASSGGVNSALSSAYTLDIDTTAPNAPTGISASSTSQPAITGTAEAGSTVTVYVDGVAVGTVTANGSGAWSHALGSPLTDGAHSIRATATDAAGNVSGQSAARDITVDTAAPAAPSGIGLSQASDSGNSHSDGVTNNAQPTITGTAEANSTVTVYVDGVAVGTATTDGSGAWGHTLSSPLADGAHSIRATATDAAGNVSGQSSAYGITIDTTAPNAPTGINVNQPTITGTAEAGSTVTVYVDGVAVGTATADGTGAWSHSLGSPLVDGTHSIRATATDAAGNVSGQSTARDITVDTAAPAAPSGVGLSQASDSGNSHSDGVTNNAQPTITGTAEAGSTVTVYVDGLLAGTATADGSGAWSLGLNSPLADGSHDIQATATDAAGNVSAQSSAHRITVDTAVPQLQSFTQLDAAATSAGPVRYDLVFNEAVSGLSADALSLVTTGSARGAITSLTRLSDSHYVVTIGDTGGDGSLALALNGGGVSDAAGNVNARQLAANAYQLSTPVITPPPVVLPPLVVTPPVTTPPATVTTTIALPPITPNIVLAATGGTASLGTTTGLGGEGLTTTGQGRALSVGPVGGFGAGSGQTGSLGAGLGVGDTSVRDSGLGGTLPSSTNVAGHSGAGMPFVSSLSGTSGAALQVMPDLGAQALAVGQTFNFSLPAGTVMVLDANSVLSVQARQSNGQPLPAWLKFDPQNGRFSGTPPPGWNRSLSLEVIFSDQGGHRGVTHIQLKAAGEQRSAADTAEKLAAAGKPALQAQFRQHGKAAFDEQIAAWLQAENTA